MPSNLFDDRIDEIVPKDRSAEEKLRCTEMLWASLKDAEELERATRRIERLAGRGLGAI